MKEKKVKEQKNNDEMNRLMEFAGLYKNKFGLSVVLAVLGIAAGMVPFVGVAKIVKELIGGNRNEIDYLILCLICLAGFVAKAICMGASTSVSHTATFETLQKMRETLLSKLYRCPMGYLLETPSGELKTVIIEKVDNMERFLAHMIPELTSCLAVPLVLCVYLFAIDWRMGLVTLITTPIALVCCCGMMIGYEEKFNGFMNAGKHMNSVVVEYVKGIKVIKTFNQTGSAYDKFTDAVNANAQFALNWMKGTQLFMSMALAIMPSILVTVLPIGMSFYKKGSITAEEFIAIIIVGMGIMGPLISVMKYSDAMTQLGSLMGDICKVLDVPELDRQEREAAIKDLTIELEHVSFSYEKTATEDNMVLKDVNLTIKPGTVTALVGPSGGGKSTISKMIAGFWDVTDGNVYIGGVNLKNMSQAQIAEQIAYVSQDNFLFNDTVMENIRMGRENATDEEVIQTAKLCGCHDFIMRLEKGYQTIVGEMGGHLSGGERQRIAIARAMMKNAPIIILDEATAYADPENEAQIQESVASLVKGKTLIVIAHRLSTIINADKIVVVKDGRICSTGKHEQLLKTSKLYKSMWNAYCGTEA